MKRIDTTSILSDLGNGLDSWSEAGAASSEDLLPENVAHTAAAPQDYLPAFDDTGFMEQDAQEEAGDHDLWATESLADRYARLSSLLNGSGLDDDSEDGGRHVNITSLASWFAQSGDSFRGAESIAMPRVTNLAEAFDGSEFAELIPTDPQFGQQWHLNNTGVGIDLNITDVWDDYTGAGVRVVVIDTGTDRSHEDLSANINFSLDWDYQDNDAVAEPVGSANSQHHGTAVSGIIGQVNNSVGGVGVAYDSELIIFRGYGINTSYGDEVWLDAAGLGDTTGNPSGNVINGDVVNMSAGTGSTVFFWTQFIQDAVDAMETAAEDGRGGLGTVLVKSAGNSRAGANSTLREESTAEAYDATRHTINVAAAERTGDITSYSSPGANVLTSAFAPDFGQVGIYTTDRSGSDGYNTAAGAAGNYTSTFNGTSAAAPQVAGVVALMLEANPDLGWRDVQKILALASRNVGSDVGAADTGSEQSTQTNGSTWFWNAAANGSSNLHWNGGGLHFSNDYGYGVIDALAAVRLAETWELTGTSGTGGTEVSETRDMDGFGVTTTYSTAFVNHSATFSSNVIVQHITVNVDFNIDDLADMEIFLISPNGTRVQLINDTGDTQAFNTATNAGNRGWDFGSVAFLGEQGNGIWTVQIRNDDGSAAGAFTTSDVDLTIYGDTVTTDDLFVVTNEFSEYDGVAGHVTNFAGGGGTNTINAAAVTSDSTINLLTNTGTIDGVAITNSNIQRVFTGDGADTVTGDGISEFISTGRGNDVVVGGAGAETINGGSGNDSLDGGAGNDTIDGGAGNDTIDGGLGDDSLIGGTGNDIFEFFAGSHVNDTVNGGTGTDKILLSGLGTFNFNSANSTFVSLEEIEFNADVGGTKIANFTIQEFDSTFEVPTNLLIDSSGGNIDILNFFATGSIFSTVNWSGWTFQNWDDSLDELNVTLGGAITNFTGTQERDNIIGGTNDETINGGLDNDTIDGGAGNDTIDGGAGNDSLIGGAGNDSVDGGIGNDTIGDSSGAAVDTNDTLNGGDGDDLIRLRLNGATIDGGAGTDTLELTIAGTFTTDNRTIDIDEGYSFDGGAFQGDWNNLENLISAAGLRVNLIGNSANNLLQASSQDDTITGESGNDTLIGLAGNDSLVSGAGNDSVEGGAGNDTLFDDGGGANTLNGGDGDDRIVQAFTNTNTIDGGSGIDTLVFSNTFNIAASTRVFDLDLGYKFSQGSATFFGNWSNLENLIGYDSVQAELIGNAADNLITASIYNDTLRGEGGNDTLEGRDGNDSIEGGGGNDSILGGGGNDSILGGAGDDTIDGGAGNDVLSYAAASSAVVVNLAGNNATGGEGNDSIVAIEQVIGSGFNDRLIGNGAANVLRGQIGNDTLFGGGGNDTMFGGAGNDTIRGSDGADFLHGGANNDLLIGNAGNDTLDGSAGNDVVSYQFATGAVVVNLAGNSATGADGNDSITGVEQVIGSDFNDRLIGNGAANVMRGGAGNDTIFGSGGNDTMFGGAGNDVIYGDVSAAGSQVTSDRVFGDAGNDTIHGSDGADFLHGGANNDLLIGNAGNDTLDGSAGNDVVSYQFATGAVVVNLAGNSATGADGNDSITGVEQVIGSDFNDRLIGNGAANVMRGGAGNDTIFGSAGNDTLFGGADDDTFVFTGAFGNDRINDFDPSSGDVARILGTGAGYNTFADYDANSDGVINAADAPLTANLSAAGPDLLLRFDVGGTLSLLFDNAGSLTASDLLFV